MTSLTDDTKQFLNDNYWSLWLVDTDEERVKCGRCGRVALNHRVATCKHVFCFRCIVRINDRTNCKCFKCGHLITLTSLSDKEIDRRICHLKAHCTNYKHGCNLITKLYQMPEHLKVCKNNQKIFEYFEINSPIIKIEDDITKLKNEVNVKFEEQWRTLQTILSNMNELFKKMDSTNDTISKVRAKLEDEISRISIQEISTKIEQQSKDLEVLFTESRTQKLPEVKAENKELNVILLGRENASSLVNSLSRDQNQFKINKNYREILVNNCVLRIFNCNFNRKNVRKIFHQVEHINSIALIFNTSQLEPNKFQEIPQIFSDLHRNFALNISIVLTHNNTSKEGENRAEIMHNLRQLLINYSELIKVEENNVFFIEENNKNDTLQAQKFLDFIITLEPCSTEDAIEIMELGMLGRDVAMILDHANQTIQEIKTKLDFRCIVSDEDRVFQLNVEKKLLIKTLKCVKMLLQKNTIVRNNTKKANHEIEDEDVDAWIKRLMMMEIYGGRFRAILRFGETRKYYYKKSIEKNAKKAQKKGVNIALLGESGNGKSTLINAFANYSRYSSYTEAANSLPEVCPIPTKFTHTDEEYNEVIIQSGSVADLNESLLIGQLGTLSSRSYRFSLDHQIDIRWIDTSGFGSLGGPARDSASKRDFLSYVEGLAEEEELQGVAIVVNGNQARDSERFRYCLQEVLSLFHKSSMSSFILIFTHGNKPKDGVQTLHSSLKALPEMEHLFHKDNTFFFENNVFRCLLAKEEAEVSLEEEWSSNVEEFSRLMRYVKTVKSSHDFRSTVQLHEMRNLLHNVNLMLDFIKERENKDSGSGLESERKAYVKTAVQCLAYIKSNSLLYKNFALSEYAKQFSAYCLVDMERHLADEKKEEEDVDGMSYEEVWESVKRLVLAEVTGEKFQRLLSIESKLENYRKSKVKIRKEIFVREENAIF